MNLTNSEKYVIRTSLEKDMCIREKMVEWAMSLPESNPEKTALLAGAEEELAAARSALQKLQ